MKKYYMPGFPNILFILGFISLFGFMILYFADNFSKKDKEPSILDAPKEISVSSDEKSGYNTGIVTYVDSTMPGQVRYVVGYDADTSLKTSAFGSTHPAFSVGTKVSIKRYLYLPSKQSGWRDITVVTKR